MTNPPAPSAPAAAPAAPSPLLVHATLLAVQVVFASLAVAGKAATRTVAPEVLALARVAGGAALFAAVHALRGRPFRLPGRDLATVAAAAVLGIAGNQLLFLSGLKRTQAIHASLLITTIPVFTVAIELVLGRERARPALFAGLGTAAAGVLYLVGLEALDVGVATVAGDLLILANCLAYAGYLVVVRGLVARHGADTVITLAFALGTLVVLPFAADDLAAAREAPSAATAALVLYIVIGPTIFTYLASAWALRHSSPTTVAAYVFLQPAAAAVMARIALGEQIGERVPLAAALIFVGIALVTWAQKSHSRASQTGA